MESPFTEDLDEGLTIWVVAGHRHKGTMLRVPTNHGVAVELAADRAYVLACTGALSEQSEDGESHMALEVHRRSGTHTLLIVDG